jgi:hypothetical protein
MHPFENLVKPARPFTKKCNYMHDKEVQSMYVYNVCITVYIMDCITKKTNYAQTQFSKHKKLTNM